MQVLKEYDYAGGLDVVKSVTFDKSLYLSKFNDITPIEFYFQQLQTYLDANVPGTTIEDVKRTKGIKEENLELLSPTLPYKTVVKLATLSVLSDTYRYKVGIVIPDLFGFGLSYQVSIPEIIGKRITVSYVPSTPSDVQLINQYGGFYNVPAYLLWVKPAVRVEGTIVALGDEITVGTEQELNVNIIYPSGSKTDRVIHKIKAGGYYALGIVSKGIKEDLIEQRFEKYKEVIIDDYPDLYNDPLLGEVLNMTILRYFYNLDQSKSQFAEVSHYAYSKDISEGVAIKNIDVSYIYGAPYKITPSTYLVDIQREVSILSPTDGNNSKKIEIMNLLGMTSSVLENQTLEQMMSIESISATKAIQLANERGMPIHHINQSNVTTEIAALNVSEEVKYAIRNAVNQGLIVSVPESDLQVNQWFGVGWIVENPSTGGGAYMISGYLMGGETTKPNPGTDPDPDCTYLDQYLFDDIYRAIAYVESRWSQFEQDGTTETSGSAYGIMQIQRQWKTKNWPETTNPIDWDSVLNDWTYNVALGEAIYEYGRSWGIKYDLPPAGITNPTEEQIMLNALSRYNQWKSYYKPNGKAERDNHAGCDYADAVMKIYKEQKWTDRTKLRCRK